VLCPWNVRDTAENVAGKVTCGGMLADEVTVESSDDRWDDDDLIVYRTSFEMEKLDTNGMGHKYMLKGGLN